MALSDKKLYCGDRSNGKIIDTVNLYTDLKDVQNQGKAFNYNGDTLYAKLGDSSDSKASKIHAKISQVERALLTSAVYTFDFDSITVSWLNEGVGFGRESFSVCGDWDKNINGEIEFQYSLPVNAKNAKAYVKYESYSYTPRTYGTFFGQGVNIPSSTSPTSGEISVNLKAGETYFNRIKAEQNGTGPDRKTMYFSDFRIEFNFDNVRAELIDNFSTRREIPIINQYRAAVENSSLKLLTTIGQSSDNGYAEYQTSNNSLNDLYRYDYKFEFDIVGGDTNAYIKVVSDEENYNYKRTWTFSRESKDKHCSINLDGKRNVKLYCYSSVTTPSGTDIKVYIKNIKFRVAKPMN